MVQISQNIATRYGQYSKLALLVAFTIDWPQVVVLCVGRKSTFTIKVPITCLLSCECVDKNLNCWHRFKRKLINRTEHSCGTVVLFLLF